MKGGDVIEGRFEVGRRVGEGGMGAVYRAVDRHTGQAVAIKVLHDAVEASAHGVARFLREAETLATLSHPAIVGHVAHGSSDGAPWLAMGWVEGETLADRLLRGGLPFEEVVALGRALAGALAFAHAAGVLHRDLKPANVILAGGDVRQPVVVDFGLARKDGIAQRVTRTGMTMGTPGYMAPEQARGEPNIDARADVFSLGAILFECITGRAAFEGMHPVAVIARLLLEDAPRVSSIRRDVPRSMDQLIHAMLTREAPRRTSSMADVVHELDLIEASGDLSRQLAPPSLVSFTESRVVTVAAFTGPQASAEAATMISEPRGAGSTTAIDGPPNRLVALDGGLWIALFEGDSSPSDQVERALRFAIERTRAGGRAFVATGRATAIGGTPTGQAIERVVRGITEPVSSDGVRSDELTARLGAERFVATKAGQDFVITGEQRSLRLRSEGRAAAPAFVGREREVGLILSTIAAAAADHTAHAIIVTAEPGHGKSRLVREVLERLARQEPPVRVLFGRGERMGSGGVWSLLGGLVRDAANVRDEESKEERANKIAGLVGRVLPGKRETAALVGELVGVPFSLADFPALAPLRADPVLLGDRIRDALVEWLRGESHDAVLLVLEDLHWGDPPTVRLVDLALRDLSDRPLVVLALGRPELGERFEGLFQARPRTELRLPPLGKRAAESLVRAAIPDADAPLIERLLARAGGSPLFLEELVRAVVRGERALPETVASMIEARLAELSPDGRRSLRAASVLGARWLDADVARLLELGAGEVALSVTLSELERGDVLVAHPETREHSFRHELVRDTAYATLPDHDREVAHRLAGEMLEARGEDAQRVAHHHELGGEPLRAARSWLLAARDALAGDDLLGAVERADRGLRACDGRDPQLAGALALTQCVAHRWRLRPPEASDAAARAVSFFSPGSPDHFEALAELVLAAARTGDHEAVLRSVELARSTPPESAAARLPRALVVVNSAAHHALIGEQDAAEANLAEGEVILGRALESEPRIAGRVHLSRGILAALRGELGTARAHHRAAGAHFRRVGDTRSAMSAEINTALVEVGLGLVEPAVLTLEAVSAEAERRSLTFILKFARSNLGYALSRADQLERAASVLETVIADLPVSVGSRIGASARIDRARVHLALGELEPALARIDEAITQTDPFPPMQAYALVIRARIHLASGRGADALDDAARAEAARRKLGTLEDGEVLLALTYAEALVTRGRTVEAAEVLAAARHRLRERAARLGDEALARTFLGNVAEHVQLMRGAG